MTLAGQNWIFMQAVPKHMPNHWSKYGRKIWRYTDLMSSELHCWAMVPFFLWRTSYNKFSNQQDIIKHKVHDNEMRYLKSVFSSGILNTFSSNLECKIFKICNYWKCSEVSTTNNNKNGLISLSLVGAAHSQKYINFWTLSFLKKNPCPPAIFSTFPLFLHANAFLKLQSSLNQSLLIIDNKFISSYSKKFHTFCCFV